MSDAPTCRELIPAVRALTEKGQVYELRPALPEEAFEAIFWLSEGESPEQIRASLSQKTPDGASDEVRKGANTAQQALASERGLGSRDATELTLGSGVDVGLSSRGTPGAAEMEASLENPHTARRVVRVRSADDLERMLDAPLEKWRVFLHPQQRFLASQPCSGPTLLLGGAGTGKSVVAMHRAAHLAKSLEQGDRILFTTFTANLAATTRDLLRGLAGDAFDRIDVTNLHALAVRWIESFNLKIATDDEVMSAWDQASLGLTPTYGADFLRDEWRYAFLVKGIETQKDYLPMSRVGRSPAITRRQRLEVWRAFEAFARVLESQRKVQWADVPRFAREMVAKSDQRPYRHVIVDEGQDFGAPDWKLIRAFVPPGRNDLFVVADPRQRIYHSPIDLHDCGIDLGERIHRLQVNYRTTEQIRHWATERTPLSAAHDLSGSGFHDFPTHSLLEGPEPEFVHSKDRASEARTLAKLVDRLTREYAAHEIAIVVRAKWLFSTIKERLKEAEIEFHVLDQDTAEAAGVRLATMHRVKGLEFRCVVVAGLAKEVFPTRYRGREDDQAAVKQHLESERNLLYVAATRARDRLVLSTFGEGFSWP